MNATETLAGTALATFHSFLVTQTPLRPASFSDTRYVSRCILRVNRTSGLLRDTAVSFPSDPYPIPIQPQSNPVQSASNPELFDKSSKLRSYRADRRRLARFSRYPAEDREILPVSRDLSITRDKLESVPSQTTLSASSWSDYSRKKRRRDEKLAETPFPRRPAFSTAPPPAGFNGPGSRITWERD